MRGFNKTQFGNKKWLHAACVVLILLLAVVLLWYNNAHSMQAVSAVAAQIRFEGEYRIADGPWQEITKGKHIPATKGDVTLRGNFHLYAPDDSMYLGIYSGDVPIAFYTNHINLTFYENGQPFVIDRENPLYGVNACGADWTAHTFYGDGSQPIEILVHNPHVYGNDRAVDEMLDSVALWGGLDFERSVMESCKLQRNAGALFIGISIVLLGIALFSALLHVRGNRLIWMLGLAIFFAGMALMYSAQGISFRSESTVTNTTVLGFAILLYMFFISETITYFLKETKKIGIRTVAVMGIVVGSCLILPMLTNILFYDILPVWVIVQSVVNAVILGCLLKEFLSGTFKERCLYALLALLPIAFEIDAVAILLGYWSSGIVSACVLSIMLIFLLFVVLRIIPESINAAARAKELELQRSRLEAEKNMVEAELKDSRISIMLSQIQPHFIYNTLGTIERMCLKDPEKAFELVRNFSLYLRCNFSELESMAPIRFAEELKHVEYYVNIEKVRFPDMRIEYDVETTDFVLPALSVQPLVENAIKHGLMRLESGGTVVIHSYETTTHFCVEVTDDGVGFDTSLSIDGKKHVGLRNIRGRLKAMVDGELQIESTPNEGTKAKIKIPKEVMT